MIVIRGEQIEAFEQEYRRRAVDLVIEELRKSALHTLVGLGASEIEQLRNTATLKAAEYELDNRDDFDTYIRLSFVVGQNFDLYPPFQKALSESEKSNRLLDLILIATPDDWSKAAQFDVVSRYRKREKYTGEVKVVALDFNHAEPYFIYARHPDVWRLGKMTPLMSLIDVYDLINNLNNGERKKGYAIVGAQHQFLGSCIATKSDESIGLSYWVERSKWGQGIASQAIFQLRQLYKSEKITLKIDPFNTPSKKVAIGCGFSQKTESSLEC